MKDLMSIEDNKKVKEQVAFWNEMNGESNGKIIYIEKERRFRYKKYIDGKLVSVTSRNSIKDVIDKMNCKEKENKRNLILHCFSLYVNAISVKS